MARLFLSLLAVVAVAAPVLANPAPPPDFKNTAGSTRTGLFRSCGSGAGLGLAAIGVAWGLMWATRRERRKD